MNEYSDDETFYDDFSGNNPERISEADFADLWQDVEEKIFEEGLESKTNNKHAGAMLDRPGKFMRTIPKADIPLLAFEIPTEILLDIYKKENGYAIEKRENKAMRGYREPSLKTSRYIWKNLLTEALPNKREEIENLTDTEIDTLRALALEIRKQKGLLEIEKESLIKAFKQYIKHINTKETEENLFPNTEIKIHIWKQYVQQTSQDPETHAGTKPISDSLAITMLEKAYTYKREENSKRIKKAIGTFRSRTSKNTR